ncbi:hypothetical protein FOXG_19472 [Fusarium oxysporum f. sp. lycopersici 4287]|uniref:Uncharacterized protein n=1 Tax=Fusarium oxysporum f. sp. lycopersici (strain 4287 / CBS 123668 / FGSC 9935 / NRRL 34936) TaxID=426428 RepID=A0A0J9V079_FUSO4|nr:hypothetical protein FOXG_19472 [Fusarium oxysporum f. sp. lycopersici 4287]KAI8401407.1 hypothetical protein FOFC_18276 [Fusarium oxysporum]KNB04974.1 hypothetical protein FOXG_19472 [Fusarium oxysporum f. sp. lycopersici 4287]
MAWEVSAAWICTLNSRFSRWCREDAIFTQGMKPDRFVLRSEICGQDQA